MLIQSIDRAIGILELFKKHKELDLSEITELLGLSKSTIHSIINTLAEKQVLRKIENTKKYQLGYSILELGLKQLAELEIYKQAVLPLKKLSNNVNKICSLGIWDNNSILIIERSDPSISYAQGFSSVPPIRRKPAYCTSIGKAILSFMQKEAVEAYLNEVKLLPFTKNTITNRDKLNEELSTIRDRGYSMDNKEYVSYMTSISAPIHGTSGKTDGGISIHSDSDDYDENCLNEFVDPLIRTAYEISINMGYQPGPM
jgi:DNA-binding IclR family transcriptional regulator